MKNIIPSLTMFLILICFMLLFTKISNAKFTYYNATVNSLENTISNNLWDESYESSLKYLKKWNSDRKIISIFLHHSQLDDINGSILKLTQYTKYKDKIEALALIHEIKFLLYEAENIQKIDLCNIF